MVSRGTRMLRPITYLALLAWLAACAGHDRASDFAPPAEAMTVTAYGDGLSCPGGCDAHVVFAARHDGTRNAFAPGPTLLAWRDQAASHPCGGGPGPDAGRACVICFDDSDASCLLAMHRGNGPPAGRFDVTAAFLAEICPHTPLPPALAVACSNYRDAARRLSARHSCIADDSPGACRDLMEAARAAWADDQPRYAACLAAGSDAAYNASVTDSRLHRAYDCAYFANQRNAAGLRLAPGACPYGSFVGREGYDCCGGDPARDALDPRECGLFYVEED
jgi:hypothetical protein